MRDRPRGFDNEDGSCLECDGHAVLRRRGSDGHEFHGCSNFPRCRNTGSAHPGPWDNLDDDDVADLKCAFEGD